MSPPNGEGKDISIQMDPYQNLTNKIAAAFKGIPGVEAIALGGSLVKKARDRLSDIDLYIFTHDPIPLERRQRIADKLGAGRADLGLDFWDPGDQWFDLETEIEVDLMYWDPAWIEDQVDRVLVCHRASLGYSTCHWYTIANARLLFDRTGWFENLQRKCRAPYPGALKQAVITRNYPVLRAVIPAYYNQIKKAVERGDLVSINHRLAALFASYFDLLFAFNELPHPGEKGMLTYAAAHCAIVPEALKEQVEAILAQGAKGERELLDKLQGLLDNLDACLIEQGIDPSRLTGGRSIETG